MQKEFWVQGRPATFATNHELPWKENIRNTLKTEINQHSSVHMKFHISKDNITKCAFDLDNLCEPVFAVLTTQLGWFNSKRINVKSWMATKEEGDTDGMILKCVNDIDFTRNVERAIFDGIYEGKLPNRATETEIPEWMNTYSNIMRVKKRCAVSLLFGKENLSIATISSGKVKPIIDCLYPVLGGLPGSPDDHRIMELYVNKAIEGLKENQVRITIWEI